MANTNILQLPVAVSVSSDWYLPLQADSLTTQRATIATISEAITGFVPDTATIRGGFGISITNGGLLVDSPQINFDPAAMAPVGAMDVADSFVICQTSSTGEAHIATFPDAMKGLTGLQALGAPDLTLDFLIINHAADGGTYKISPSSLSLAQGNMPAGGLAGQILTKASDANYDTTWTSGGFIDQAANTVFAGPTSGAAAQPQFRALVGADLPNPGASSKGGVQSKAVVANQFLTGISTAGVVSAAQPAFTDISGVATAAQGGTGQSSYTIGDLLYASGTTALSKLADVATGNALISGGVGVAPSWGKIGLTTHISGTLAVGNGGTGQTTLAAHGVLVGNDASGISVTGAGTLGQVLTSNGASADPTFQDATTALGQALTVGNDTNVTLTLGGTPLTALLSASSITAGWTGQLAVTRGGTGLSSIAQGDLLYGSGVNTVSALTKSTTATRYLANTGTSNNPAWDQVNLTTGVTGTLPVANGGLGITSGTSGGSLYWSNNSTLASTAVLTANQLLIGGGAGQPFASLGSLGTTTTVLHGNAAGAPTFGAVSLTADISGTLAVGNGGTGATAFNQFGVLFGNGTSAIQVTSAGTSGQVLGGNTLSAPTMRTLSAVMDDAFSNAQGALVFRGASAWTALGPGTAGYVLSTNGTSSDPTWISVGGVGTVTSVDASGGTTGFTFTGGPITGAGTLTLSGTLIAANGGTGLTTYAQGDLIYASAATPTLSRLAKDTNATRYLSNTGTNNNPAWAQIDLTNGVTGTLPVANGGTGRTTLTSHGVLVGAGTSAVTQLAAAAAGTVLAGAGTGSDPAFSATPTLGVAGTTQGSLAISGATSGTVTTAVQAAAGTYNFNLPTSAGTSGQPLLSGGGGATPMSFGTLGRGGGGTGSTTGAFLKIAVQVFTSSGTYTPTTGMLYCIIECVGGGGAGGGVIGVGNATKVLGGGGGGTGSYSRVNVNAATIGASQTVTVGGAGTGSSGATGGTGGATSVGTVCVANGGGGGVFCDGSTGFGLGGVGGSSGTGDLASSGSPGGQGFYFAAAGNAFAISGLGGSSIFGGGGRATINGGSAVAGSAATGYGSGGAGASVCANASNAAGGNGFAGIVVITEFCNQ